MLYLRAKSIHLYGYQSYFDKMKEEIAMVLQNWNRGWYFTKDAVVPVKEGVLGTGSWQKTDLPWTWNGEDGQDGGNDYYRGTCCYAKTFSKADLPEGEETYLEFRGANSSADVYLNGEKLAHHDGGYSIWRVRLTGCLNENNEIVVAVDNAKNDFVYPQMADFTFYGGLYRDVNLIGAGKTRFSLDDYGSQGVSVTPKVSEDGSSASVFVKCEITGGTGEELYSFEIRDGQAVVAQCLSSTPQAQLSLENVHLWNGVKDPHLYMLHAEIQHGQTVLDTRDIRFGCRTFRIDPDQGFFLNGRSYPLHGAARHQDRPHKGNALSKADHEEDIALLLEMGANTVRLAHYEHDPYFYDLCDEKGLVVWAEIPYISRHMPKGRANTISQMTELIKQNNNHPSIVVWGLSNEITMGGTDDPDLISNHKELNNLVHQMDPTRLTTMAVVSMCPVDARYLEIPDVLSWNLYFGWYGGDTSMNGPFFDKFHALHPTIPVGMSEYGAEALNWHTSHPVQGDYTEEYQAHYHEELIKQLFTRPFIWATHVWNMFDFAADGRDEGGEAGMNHKGLVTFDRKYKKDAFYAYKAWLSDEPFVHLCGKRYVDRVEEVTKVTVYSNQPQVELFVNGRSLGIQTSDVHFFYFDVPNKGESTLTARAGDCTDTSCIRKVDKPNEAYIMKEKGAVLNWFDITAPEGCYSVNDSIGDIMKSEEGRKVLAGFMKVLTQNQKPAGMDVNMNDPGMKQMIAGFTVKRVISTFSSMNKSLITKEQILELNARLNQIRKG